jgi:hypothetical protein
LVPYVFLDRWRYFDCGRRKGRRRSYSAFAPDAKGRHERKRDQPSNKVRTSSFSSDVPMFNEVPGANPAGGELRSISGQHAEEPPLAIVDEGDFVQVHGARACRIRAVVHLPTFPELVYPGAGKAVVQIPCLFRRRFTETDLQVATSLGVCR